METSITSETILQHTMYWDNEGLNVDMETNKEQIKFEQKPNQFSTAREIYFKYFSSQKMAKPNATVWKRAMMALPLVTSLKGRTSKGGKGKTP